LIVTFLNLLSADVSFYYTIYPVYITLFSKSSTIFTFGHLADGFIQRYLQMMTITAISYTRAKNTCKLLQRKAVADGYYCAGFYFKLYINLYGGEKPELLTRLLG